MKTKVEYWTRRTSNQLGGKCAQAFIRIGAVQFAAGWVTRYVGVPKFFMLKKAQKETSRVIEFHFWRLRLAVCL